AMIFEKHIAVETETYPKNAYSATPIQIKKWLESAQNAFQMAGVADQRKSFSEKEICDLRQFKRGVFLKKPVKTGDAITVENTFFAFPNSTDQLLANDMSKYTTFTAKRDLDINEPVFQDDVDQAEIREKVYAIVTEVRKILKKGNIIFPGQADLEISHHYGLDRFHQFGVTMITVVNREYCKKLIIMLPGQSHPEQFHKIKEETFIVLFGELSINIDGIEKQCKAGEAVTIQSGEKHSFTTKTGAVIEEISSTHLIDDSYYTDPKIMGNPHRKTFLTHWIDD
ncbi:MAG: cupin domain-containing protein, partial [Fidelibacterota bacterium]